MCSVSVLTPRVAPGRGSAVCSVSVSISFQLSAYFVGVGAGAGVKLGPGAAVVRAGKVIGAVVDEASVWVAVVWVAVVWLSCGGGRGDRLDTTRHPEVKLGH